MRESDPQNLRQPAVRLLARMLPGDARSGVWTFGQYVNMLVPSGEVSSSWRDTAVERSDRINSVALRTNIGEALEVASDDFYGDRRFDNTHFILLTDGVVDISPNALANARERNRILDEVVERIQGRGATIHTIALSENADLALLERLAVKTGGTFAVAPDAESLNRVFAETLNTAAPQPEVPIRDNQFTVSEDVKEFTALVFGEGGEKPLALVTPSGQRIEAARLPDNARWHAEGEYDLITMTEPEAGVWRIDGQLGEQSRVTVVSDLRMAVSPVPNFFYSGQPVAIEAAFYEKDSRITNPDFLGVLDVAMTLQTEDGRSGTKTLSGETPPENGVYADTIEKLSEPGTYDLTLSADGKTFARQFSSRITLRPPVNVEVKAEGQGGEARYIVEVRPEHPELNPQASDVGLKVAVPGQTGEAAFEAITFDETDGVWRASVTPTAGDGDYTVNLRFRGETGDGRSLSYAPASFVAQFPRSDAGQTAYTSLSAPTVTASNVGKNGGEPTAEPANQESLLGPDIADEAPSAETGAEEAEPQPSEPQQPEPQQSESSAPPADTKPAPDAADAQEEIAPPIDVSQAEAPAEPPEEASPQENSPFWAQIPIWVWAALGGAVALAAIVFAVIRARRRKEEPKPDETEGKSATDESDEAEDEALPPVIEPAEAEEPEEPLAEMGASEDETSEEETPAEVEPEPPVAEEEEPALDVPGETEPPVAESDSDDVPVLGDTETETVEPETAETEIESAEFAEEASEVPDEVEPPIASTEIPGEEDLTGADETADEIERFLAEARQDDAGLDIANEDILEEPESPAAESEEDEHMLEDFDLSDIDDLPDLDEEPDEDSSTGESENKRQN
ncbi:vWA domain-containing protein [Marinobacter fonticola]|uniref:vWA domain-containing protein n=1 Tax=Marinobacter fonticola TaxID=2603215 RepID=UPI00143DF87C|nr:VWA domain-containing protein [Marinobacter fonticola]